MNRKRIITTIVAVAMPFGGCGGGGGSPDTYLSILEADDILDEYGFSDSEALLLGEEICKTLDNGTTEEEIIDYMDDNSIILRVDASVIVFAANQNLCDE